MYIPGLNETDHSIVKGLTGFYCKFLCYGGPILPLSVRLVKTNAPVGRIVRIVLILMKSHLLKAKKIFTARDITNINITPSILKSISGFCFFFGLTCTPYVFLINYL